MRTILRRRIALLSKLLLAVWLAGPAAAVPPPGINSWWPADGNADDVVGGNHGTLHGGASFTSGRVGQSFDLSGPGDYVSAGHTPYARGSDFTVAIWTKLAQSPTDPAFAIETRKNQVFGWAVTVWTDDHYVLAGRCDNASTAFNARSNAATTPGQWHHVAMAFDWQSDEIRIHVDGCFDSVADLSACDGFTSTDKFFLGASSALTPEFNLQGQLDEVQTYNRALSVAEIRSVFEDGGLPANCAAAVPALPASWIWGLLLATALAATGALAARTRRSQPLE